MGRIAIITFGLPLLAGGCGGGRAPTDLRASAPPSVACARATALLEHVSALEQDGHLDRAHAAAREASEAGCPAASDAAAQRRVALDQALTSNEDPDALLARALSLATTAGDSKAARRLWDQTLHRFETTEHARAWIASTRDRLLMGEEEQPRPWTSPDGRWAIVGRTYVDVANGREQILRGDHAELDPRARWAVVSIDRSNDLHRDVVTDADERRQPRFLMQELATGAAIGPFEGDVAHTAFDAASRRVAVWIKGQPSGAKTRSDSVLVLDTESKASFEVRGGGANMKFSPGGKLVVWREPGAVAILDAERAGVEPRRVPLRGAGSFDFAVSNGAEHAVLSTETEPDKKRVVEREVVVVRLNDGAEVLRRRASSWLVSEPGPRLAFSSPRSGLTVHDLTTGAETKYAIPPATSQCEEWDWRTFAKDKLGAACADGSSLTIDLMTKKVAIDRALPIPGPNDPDFEGMETEERQFQSDVAACERAGGERCDAVLAPRSGSQARIGFDQILAPRRNGISVIDTRAARIHVDLADSADLQPDRGISIHRFDQILFARDQVGRARLWDLRTGGLTWSGPAEPEPQERGALVRRGGTITVSRGGVVRRWNPRGEVDLVWKAPEHCLPIAIAPDASPPRVACRPGGGPAVAIHEASTPAADDAPRLATFSPKGTSQLRLAMDPSGVRVAIPDTEADAVTIASVTNAAEQRTIAIKGGCRGPVLTGNWLGCESPGAVYDLRIGKPVISVDKAHGVAISRDGASAAILRDGAVEWIDLASSRRARVALPEAGAAVFVEGPSVLVQTKAHSLLAYRLDDMCASAPAGCPVTRSDLHAPLLDADAGEGGRILLGGRGAMVTSIADLEHGRALLARASSIAALSLAPDEAPVVSGDATLATELARCVIGHRIVPLAVCLGRWPGVREALPLTAERAR